MASTLTGAAGLSPDVLVLVFEHLVGDATSLCNVGLTSHNWRALSLPCLLRQVDLSSHNNGRLPEHEHLVVLPVVYADFSGSYRPCNLVPRQRAFLRLITARPGLAKHIRSLTWTLIWRDFDDDKPTDIDRETWTVFSQMTKVTHLDLGSLHDVDDDEIVRQNPDVLFPAVTSLRLLGWMHRGLVKAIITSLDAGQLRSLELDYLQDEGALPDGAPMPQDFAVNYARRDGRTSGTDVVDDDLFQRQETNKAFIFPGPMWLPLQLLSSSSLDSLTHLQVKIPPFSMQTDSRNYYTLFQKTAELINTARGSLTSLTVVLGEAPSLYDESPSQCGTSRTHLRYTYRPWCIKLAAAFLRELLSVLNHSEFHHLKQVTFKGFHSLETANAQEASHAQLAGIFQAIQVSKIINATYTELSNVDHHPAFLGFDYTIPEVEDFQDAFENS